MDDFEEEDKKIDERYEKIHKFAVRDEGDVTRVDGSLLNEMLKVRIGRADLEKMQLRADAEGLSISQWVRKACQNALVTGITENTSITFNSAFVAVGVVSEGEETK